MAGGDGSQALVAKVAAELGYACIPAGTRDDFARDLGVPKRRSASPSTSSSLAGGVLVVADEDVDAIGRIGRLVCPSPARRACAECRAFHRMRG
jgi:Diacylglycerol kinase catalytic domain